MKRLGSTSLLLWIALLMGACIYSANGAATQMPPAAASPTAQKAAVMDTVAPNTVAANTVAPAPSATGTATPTTAPFTGSPPGEPPSGVSSWLTDPFTPHHDTNAYAIDGDDFAHNRFERPFDDKLAFRPDLDIHAASLTHDSQWFYVTIGLDGVNTGQGVLAACYGIELDLNIDGRGEFVFWARPPFTTAWSREAMIVYGTSTNMVGGPQPVLSDAPWKGDTYNKIIFDGKNPSDLNAAWVRVSPADPKSLQIAFSAEVIQNPIRFLWNAWADDGIKDPSKFDYNDLYTKAEAGSAYKWDPDYPPKSVWAVDNTCRAPYGFKPNGIVLGGCTNPATPGPTQPGATPTRTPVGEVR
jgi:hypothetical protein